MFNTTYNPNGSKLALIANCCNFQNHSTAKGSKSYPMPRQCSCAPSSEALMCHEAEKWLYHIPNTEVKSISQNYTKVVPSYSLMDSEEIAIIIHKHCKYKFSTLRKTKQQQQALQRILRRIAGELKLKKAHPYMQVYGWLGAQLIYHAGEATSYFILRHLIMSMHLYDQIVFQEQQLLVVQKMVQFIPQALQILKMYNIDVMQIIRFHSNSLMSESIPQNLMGWLITEYLKNGWKTFVDVMCSFIDHRLEGNMAESRQQLYKMFFTGFQAEWPWVFCNMNMKI